MSRIDIKTAHFLMGETTLYDTMSSKNDKYRENIQVMLYKY